MARNRYDVFPDEVPLTFAQQLLRFLDFVHPDSAFASGFSTSGRYRICGPLDVAALRRSLTQVIERHDALRSVIVLGSGVPYQKVSAEATADLRVQDLSHAPENEHEAVIEQFFSSNELADHDCSKAPLIWVALGSLSPDNHLLSVVVHHPVCDAWSLGIIMRDLAEFYAATTENRPPKLDPAPQHSAYAWEQQARLEREVEDTLDYWKVQLAEARIAAIRADHERRADTNGEKAVLQFDFSAGLATRVEALARRHRATVFVVLLSAFEVCLRRITGEEDITVPVVTYGRRERPEIQDLVGFIAEAQLLRTSLEGNPTLDEVVQRVRRTCLDAYANDAPAVLVLDAAPDAALLLSDERYVLAPFQYLPEYVSDHDGVGVRDFGGGCTYVSLDHDPNADSTVVTLPLDALVTLVGKGDGFVGKFVYSVDLLDKATMERLGLGLSRVTELLVSAPDTRLADVDLGA